MKKNVIIILTSIFVIFIFAGAWLFSRPFNPAGKKGSLTIKNQTFAIEVADTMMSRMRGLSGRDELGEHDGMLFVFDKPSASGFWMKDMKFPLDIIWLRGNRIIGFSENLPAEPKKSIFTLPVYYPPEPVDRVLEVNAGVVKQYNFAAGDEVSISL